MNNIIASMLKNYLKLLFITLFFISCSNNKLPEEVKELQAVIDHYRLSGDSLKYKAAIFLIKNMKTHASYSGEGLKTYDLFFETIMPLQKNASLSSKVRENKIKFIADSLGVLNATLSLKLKPDAKFIKSSYLIENIDLAFKAWRTYPWSRTNVSFEDFCRYVLPYKVYQEPIQSWRKTIMDRYNWVSDSMQNPQSLREATLLINNTVDNMFSSKIMEKLPAVSFDNLEKGRIGKCHHEVTLNIYLLRAMGIPVKWDYVPLWGNRSRGGHAWCSITDENGQLYAFSALQAPLDITTPSFLGDLDTIPWSIITNRKAPKIYRRNYEG
ncbi:MAG: transglutaminase-like domain-containing protein, partial [Flavobacteriaceae bacterium]|nr:transglutaminase-like domain-containing protein [Flavobacteriaceae bacterium]